jgi:hypothetical protein
MEKGQVIGLNNMLIEIQNNIDNKELKPFKFMFVRNQHRAKKDVKEQQAIIKAIIEGHENYPGVNATQEELQKFNETVNDWLNDYLKTDERYKSFLKEESDFKPFQLKISELKDADFNMAVATALMENNLLVEEFDE